MVALRYRIESPLKVGFTLVELSIVLVIIGLIIGGVLVGRDLTAAAQVRAQISQIDKYQTAANTFRSKYGYLPGDIPDPTASQFGFLARGGGAEGMGDGNGAIEGVETRGWNPDAAGAEATGEAGMFWVDLNAAGLIGGNFNTARPNSGGPASGYVITAASTPYNLDNFFPRAKVGDANYIVIWSGGPVVNFVANSDGKNYFAVFGGITLDNQNNGGEEFYNESSYTANSPGVSVAQAFAIDSKIDDGLPTSGNVLTLLPFGAFACWIDPDINHNNGRCGAPASSVTSWHLAGSSSTCSDNNNVAGVTRQYSMGQNNGAGLNCGLSFRFQ